MSERTVINRRTTAAEVANILRRRILNGELPEGAFIRQEAVAAELGVSRIPVREALTQLEAEGIVEREKFRGAIVPKLTVDELRELYALRGLLEPYLLDQAFDKIDPATLSEANDLIERSTKTRDPEEWATLNAQLHIGLYARAEQPVTLQVLNQVLKRADRYLKVQRTLSEELIRESDTQHFEIIDLIRAGNRQEALDALRRHIAWNETDLENILERARQKPE